MKKNVVVLFLMINACVSQVLSQTLYVAPDGAGNSFTVQTPGSLEGVKAYIRTINQNMNSDITVILKNGSYQLDSTFILTALDSASNGHKIIYKAENPRQAFVSGGQEISGFSNINGLWEMDVPAGMKFRQIYVDGKPAIRARQPNVDNAYRTVEWLETTKSLSVNGNEIYNWNNLNQVEIVISKSWTYSHLRIAGFTLLGNTATVSIMEPERTVQFADKNPPRYNNTFYYYENAKEFIDMPGEWYHDTVLNKLYYLPRTGETMSSVVTIPVLENLVVLNGTSNIVFQDIVFQYSNWTRPSEIGFIGGQAAIFRAIENGIVSDYIPTGAIQIEDTKNITFSGNLISNIGGLGIALVSGTQNSKINGNVFDHIASSGVVVGSGSSQGEPVDYQLPHCVRDTIMNNYFIRNAEIYNGSVPITTIYTNYVAVLHNEVVECPYSGMSIGWGWSSNTYIPGSQVNYNYVHNYMYRLQDGGGIYTLSNQEPGSVMTGNFIKDLYLSNMIERNHPTTGIYLDNRTSGYTVSNNVLRQNEFAAPEAGTPIYTGPYTNNSISNTYSNNTEIENNAGLESAYQSITNWVDPPSWHSRGRTVVKQNIALNKVTTSSGNYSSNLTSNKGNNYLYYDIWASNVPATGEHVWWQVDLASTYKITLVELVARQNMDQAWTRKNFEIRASNEADFSTYTVLATQGDTAYADKGKWVKEITNPNAYRYIRVFKTDSEPLNFSEFRAEGVATAITIATTNIAMNKPTSASGRYSSDYSWEMGNDNSLTSLWDAGSASPSNPGWWQVDLQGNYLLNKVELVSRQNVDQPYARCNLEIRASNDSTFSTYTTLSTIGSTPYPYQGSWATAITLESSYRYIRVIKPEGWFNFSEFRAYGTLADGTNIALNKPASASGRYSSDYSWEMGNDNSLTSLWDAGSASPSNPGWWQVDLQGNYLLNKVELVSRQDVDHPYARCNLEIRASNDPTFSTYTTLSTIGSTPYPYQGTWTTPITTESSYRYIRVIKPEGWFNFSEFRAYGVAEASNNINIALNKPTTASGAYNPDYLSSMANDNSTTTLWDAGSASPSNPGWWQVDLQGNFLLNKVELVSRQNSDQPYARCNLEIRASNDPTFSTYTTLSTIGSTPYPYQGTWTSLVSLASSFQYIRVMKPEGWFNFSEFRAYGKLDTTLTTLKSAYVSTNIWDSISKSRKDSVSMLSSENLTLSNSNAFIVYPNPSANVVNVKILALENPSEINITLTDVGSGRLVFNRNFTTKFISIDTCNFTSGIYAMRITDTTGNLLGINKLIVAK